MHFNHVNCLAGASHSRLNFHLKTMFSLPQVSIALNQNRKKYIAYSSVIVSEIAIL